MKIIKSFIAVTLVLGITQVFGYPPQERLMPDGAPVPEDAVVHEDSVASPSEVAEEYDDGDDSDMYMEPEDSAESYDKISQPSEPPLKSQPAESPKTPINSSSTNKKETVEASADKATSTEDQETKNTNVAVAARNPESDDKSLETDSQNFFPSFAEIFGNPRLSFSEQQQRYRPNRFLGYFQRDRGNYQAAASSSKDVQHPILGSGNFGVIRGGTYYPEDKENDEYSLDDGGYNPYYNSRGRANYYRNPKPQPIRGGDFFANFRDFADITAPPKSSFSHLSVVYANKNGSAAGRITEPRNIIETLRMLEEEEEKSNSSTSSTTEEAPRKKLSKGKRKLIKMRQYEEDKARRSRLSVEPLLALS